ncbi:MAG TPA: DUF3592 domain-containing protein [Flavobacteriaceae bacterium]|jgi:hypothetical protein
MEITNKAKDYLIWIGIIVILIISYIKWQEKQANIRELSKNNLITIGKIIDHRVTGLSENFYVKYEYTINGITYTKEVNYSDKFRNCYFDRKCIGKKFIVYYDKNNPDNAVIDFENEK